MAAIGILTTKDVNGGCVMRLRISRSYSLRMKIGAWLIGLAGRIMHMPCEIEIMRKDDDLPGHASKLRPITNMPKPGK